jgi:DNA-binding LacI/PurR family transcriptional regulator
MATIKDVANLSGVSFSTVSIIINGHAESRKISLKTQEKVMKAIKELNYQPNVSARKLKSVDNNEYTIGVYWSSDFRTSFLARIIEGIQSAILKSNFPINIVICPYKNNKLHLEKGLKDMNTFNAAIIANTSSVDNEYLNKSILPIPVVLYNRYSDMYNTVCIDNALAGKKAAIHLINKGISSIGMISGKQPLLAMNERSRSFFETCKENNIDILPQNALYSDNTLSNAAKTAEEFLKSGSVPKAIYCDSDIIAQGAIHTFNKQGIRIPEDIEIIAMGMGNPEARDYITPSLTAVEIPMEKLAEDCINLVIDILKHNIDEPRHIFHDATLVIRESSPK